MDGNGIERVMAASEALHGGNSLTTEERDTLIEFLLREVGVLRHEVALLRAQLFLIAMPVEDIAYG